ncbi:MAG: carbamate kinase, partial [Candidatus Cloacimonetes bacterium]|nr:carbamate kinase [Candidatus Cloacimonadota bacterium]
KGFASVLLAEKIDAGLLVILTGVDNVCVNFGNPDQREIDTLTVAEVREYYNKCQFPKGSMGPKMRASIRFIERGGKEVLITSIERIVDAFAGKTGTRIIP